MLPPSNFYSYQYGLLNEVWGDTQSTKNIPYDQATLRKVGAVWKNIFDAWIENAAPLVIGDVEQGYMVLGSGQWISQDLFLTCAHNLEIVEESFSVISRRGETIEISLKSGYINKIKDFALFKIQAPSACRAFPKLEEGQLHFSQRGMIHFSYGAAKAHVTTGNPDAVAHTELVSLSDIDGGPGSSGACVFNDLGEVSHLHRGRKKEFESIRAHLPIAEIMQDYQEHLSTDLLPGVTLATHSFPDEEPEHGLFTCQMSKTSDQIGQNEFPSKVFHAARDLIFEVINTKKIDFFSKAYNSPGTIYRYHSKDPQLASIRIDIQKPTKGYSNIHVQCEGTSLAGILLSKELSFFSTANQALISSFVNYSLGKLLDCLFTAEKNINLSSNHVFIARIDPQRPS